MCPKMARRKDDTVPKEHTRVPKTTGTDKGQAQIHKLPINKEDRTKSDCMIAPKTIVK
jgi:hypothetical protein